MTIKILHECPNKIRKIILNRFKRKFVVAAPLEKFLTSLVM